MTRPDKVTTPTDEAIDRFVLELCHRADVKVHTFPDGTRGLINVPAKYVAVIDAMHVALVSVARGDGLPEFATPPPRKRGRR